jgi:tellurite resistance protein TehA-like permease
MFTGSQMVIRKFSMSQNVLSSNCSFHWSKICPLGLDIVCLFLSFSIKSLQIVKDINYFSPFTKHLGCPRLRVFFEEGVQDTEL